MAKASRALEGDIFSGDNILPLGRVVYEDLSENETFLEQIQFKEPLSCTDFYVDMVGGTAVPAEEQAVDGTVLLVQVVTVLVAFPLLHMLGSKLGIWGAYFSFRKKEREWE